MQELQIFGLLAYQIHINLQILIGLDGKIDLISIPGGGYFGCVSKD